MEKFYKKSRKAVALLLIFLLVAPFTFFTQPRQSEAITETVVVIGSILEPIQAAIDISSAATAGSVASLVTKEYVLDAITWAAKSIIHGMTTSIINWINSGFEGGPTFVTDLGAFLIDVADQELGTFIESGDLNFLCSPFSFPVQLQLLIDYYRPYRDRASCTVTEIAGNLERFIQGDFREMGWQGWFDVSTRQRNNPYGSLILAQSELNSRIAWAQRIQQKILEFGKGFFSDCRDDTDTPRRICLGEIKTPGVVIEGVLEEQLGTGLRQLELADEINEIVAALIAQLVQQTLVGGLYNLSSRDKVDRISYLDRLLLEADSTTDLTNNKNALISVIDTDIGQETEYRTSKQDILNELNIAEDAYTAVISCYEDKIVGGGLTSSEIATANSRIDSASATIADTISPRQTTTTEAIRVSDLNLDLLNALREDALFARTDEELDVVGTNYSDLIAEDILHFRADLEDFDLLNEAESFISDGESKLNECNAFPVRETAGGGECVPAPLAPC